MPAMPRALSTISSTQFWVERALLKVCLLGFPLAGSRLLEDGVKPAPGAGFTPSSSFCAAKPRKHQAREVEASEHQTRS